MTRIAAARRLAIAEWIDDQFETAEPVELDGRPAGLADLPSWHADPRSGVTGTIYLARKTVFYQAPDMPPGSGWWAMGTLPATLREVESEPGRQGDA